MVGLWDDPGGAWADGALTWSGGRTTTVEIRVNGIPLDPCDVALPLEISHGRSRGDAQPDAPTLSMVWAGPVTLPADVTGTIIEVQDGDYYRFAGRISDLIAIEAQGDLVQWDVRAVGFVAELGRKHVTITRPAESDMARVGAIAAAAGVTGGFLGNPTVNLAADTIDTDALSALHEVCQSSGGLLFQIPSGTAYYGGADHRALAPILGTLPACSIVDGVQWQQSAESIVNHITVTWGTEVPELLVVSQVTHSDAASISTYGMRHVDVTTHLAAEEDADQLGLLILARRKSPYWDMPGVLIEMGTLSDDEAALVRQLQISSAVLAPITPTPNPTPGALSGWTVEGWVERWDESGHWLQLALSDRARWVLTTFRTWTEAAEATWADEAAGSWLDALIVEVAA